MPTILDKVKTAVSSLTKGTFKLESDTNVDSQIVKSDLAKPDDAPESWDDRQLIKLGKERYEESRQGRFIHNADIFTGLAFNAGNHRSEWNADQGAMLPSDDTSATINERFYHKRINMIPVMTERAVSRLTAEYPDAYPIPMRGENEQDKTSAQIDRSIIAHCKRKTHLAEMIAETALDTLLTTTAFIEVGWNNKDFADIGIPQPDGTVDYHRARLGDVWHGSCLATDIYPDPNCARTNKGIHGGAYVIKKHTLPVDAIFAKWGVMVDASDHMDTFSWIEQRISYIANDYNYAGQGTKNASTVTEMWELPSEQYEDGRFIVWCGDQMLHKGVWPYEKRDKYPFVEFWFRKNKGSVWALNMVKDLIPIQIELNRAATLRAGRREWDMPVLLVPDTAEIAPDDYLDPHYGKQIGYRGENVGGQKPEWQQPPPSPNYNADIQELIQEMELVAGVRDFNSDAAPSVNSGVEYEMRMDTDKSRLAPMTRRFAAGVAEIYEWDLALYRQFATDLPRFLGVDDSAIDKGNLQGENASATAMVDIKLAKEGQSRVIIQPGSGVGKLPAAQDERLDQIVKIAAELPSPILDLYLHELQSIKSDVQIDNIVAAVKGMEAQEAASKPNPMQVQQANAAAQQALQTQKLQFQQQENALELAADQQKAAIEVHAELLKQNARAQADQSTEMLRQQAPVVPSVSIAVKAGGEGTASAEQLAGFGKVDDPDAITKMLIPPKPSAANPQAKKGTS